MRRRRTQQDYPTTSHADSEPLQRYDLDPVQPHRPTRRLRSKTTLIQLASRGHLQATVQPGSAVGIDAASQGHMPTGEAITAHTHYSCGHEFGAATTTTTMYHSQL